MNGNQKLMPVDIAMQALAAMVLGHVPVREMNFRPKCIYLATMARRVLMATVDENLVDDRDYVGNKRLELWVMTCLELILGPVNYSRCSSKIRSKRSIVT
jgi:DNA-directed RNA polymerase beta subunit